MQKLTKIIRLTTNNETTQEFKSTAVLPYIKRVSGPSPLTTTTRRLHRFQTRHNFLVSLSATERSSRKVYVGETGRAMQYRIKEHDRDIQLAHTQTSAVPEHTNDASSEDNIC